MREIYERAHDALAELYKIASESEAALWNEAAQGPLDRGEGEQTIPPGEEQVLVFLNGHVELYDHPARNGGGWGMRFGWFDHDRRCWYVSGTPEAFVTHWRPLPAPPARRDI